MELNPLGWLATAATVAGGFALNLLAADAYDRCPRLARWMLDKAIAALPEDKRERYREEWEAHLADCDTKLDQVRHAFGAWWSVEGIVATAPRQKRKLDLRKAIAGAAILSVTGIVQFVLDAMAGAPLVYLLGGELPSLILTIGGTVFLIRARRMGGNHVEV